jgi:hypothetical protein
MGFVFFLPSEIKRKMMEKQSMDSSGSNIISNPSMQIRLHLRKQGAQRFLYTVNKRLREKSHPDHKNNEWNEVDEFSHVHILYLTLIGSSPDDLFQ